MTYDVFVKTAAVVVMLAGCEQTFTDAQVETLSEADIDGDAPRATMAAPSDEPSLFDAIGDVFGARSGVAPAVDESEIPPLTQQPFGALSRTCGLGRGDLGTRVAASAGFDIYDTAPGTTTIRPHYVTGFDDGCARQFSAALVLTGDVGTHEIVRYSDTRVDLPYSATDTAYEAIKAGFCRVAHGTPCGSRLERLGRQATFVTAYERFGAGPVWAEFLLYDGQVAGVALEGG